MRLRTRFQVRVRGSLFTRSFKFIKSSHSLLGTPNRSPSSSSLYQLHYWERVYRCSFSFYGAKPMNIMAKYREFAFVSHNRSRSQILGEREITEDGGKWFETISMTY